VLVHFWATWCPVCLHELEALARVAPLAEGAKVRIVAIALQDTPEAVLRIKNLLHPPFPLVLGHESLQERFGVSGLPVTMVVDAHSEPKRILHPETGQEVERIEGPVSWGSKGSIRMLFAAGR
jgi:thiol-disulfide isomerase/thioredoxin